MYCIFAMYTSVKSFAKATLTGGLFYNLLRTDTDVKRLRFDSISAILLRSIK